MSSVDAWREPEHQDHPKPLTPKTEETSHQEEPAAVPAESSTAQAGKPDTGLRRFLRFSVVGVINTAIHYAVYLSLWWFLPYLVAHVLAVTVAMSCSYVLNCRFTFRVRPRLLTFLLYPLTNITNIILSTLAVWVLVEAFTVDSRIATILGGIAAIPATFVVSKIVLTGKRARVGSTSHASVR